jgi:hypothetical protein
MKESKTPKFDALIDEILSGHVPHNRVCADCKKEFKIEEGDINFLKIFRVPAPKCCPTCRERRRLAFANYSNIYKRKCDAPGHTDTMISLVAPVMPWVTYDHDKYYSDSWDPISYGTEVDQKASFFNQFLGLLKRIPQPGVRRGKNCINSDFCFYGESLKDGYYAFGGRRSENILFSAAVYDSKNIMDSYFVRDVDTGFNNVTTSDCYKCFFAYFSSNCLDSEFIYDCRNCQNCFGCVNLRNKKYCWFNEQLTKEEYEKRRAQIDLGSRKITKEYQKKFWDLVKENPIRAVRNFQSVDVSGNDIKRSKNCQNAFQTEDSENVRYTAFVVFKLKDSMDIGFSGRAEKNYEASNTSTNSSNVKFAYAVKESSDSEFLISCNNCHDCFGCIGLRNKSYCIFNKQYEPEEYYKVLDEIKSKMLENVEYGEFFPMSFAPIAYNSSLANILYPMTEGEAQKRGLYWQPEIKVETGDIKIIKASELSDNIKDITDEIYNVAIIGEVSGKPFRLVKQEVDYYKRYNLALPSDTPHQRIIDRFEIVSNFRLYDESCFNCKKKIKSAHKTSSGYKPYCEECYLKVVV